MEEAEANWSNLPLDLLCLFADRLFCVEDFVRFGAVCTSWRLAAAEARKGRRFSPWLMHATLDNDDMGLIYFGQQPTLLKRTTAAGIRRCYSVSSGRTFDLRLPELQGRRCWGTNFGWLFTLGLDFDIFLFNPLTRARIPLPSQRNFPPQPTDFLDNREHICRVFIEKVALSSDPADDNPSRPLTVMVAYGGIRRLAFASPGAEAWTYMDTASPIQNIIYLRNKFVCVSCHGVFRYCVADIATPCTMRYARAPEYDDLDPCSIFYLVEISKKLYMITRNYEEHTGDKDNDAEDNRLEYERLYALTTRFSAYQLNFQNRQWSPRRKHLDGYAVFLGNNQTFVISPSDYPEFKPDCIYYTDDHGHYGNRKSDTGIYDYKNDTIVSRSIDTCCQKLSNISRAVFFMPQLS